MIRTPRNATSRLRQAARRLRRRPFESLFAVVALGLALGAAAATWTVVDAALLQPLPGDEDGRLVTLIQTRLDDGARYTVNSRNARAWRQARQLDGVVAGRPAAWTLLAAGDVPRRVEGHEVEPGTFRLLGLEARLGRDFEDLARDDADRAVLDRAVLVSDAFWRTELGADPEAVGRTLRFADGPRTVVGVMPPLPRVERLSLGDLWVPLELPSAGASASDDEVLRGLRVLARLGDEASVATAQAELDALAASLARERPETHEGWGVTVEPVATLLRGPLRAPLLSLLAVVGLVLLVSVATVATLAVARGLDRRGEVAVRRALGARRRDLASGWLVEWALLGALGGVAGWLPAAGGLRLLAGLSGEGTALSAEAALGSPPSLLVLLLASGLAAGMAVGVLGLPTLLARPRPGGRRAVAGDVASALRGGRTATATPGGTLGVLVAAQTGLAVVALVAALVLARSLVALGDVRLGFEPDGLLTFQLDLPAGASSSATGETVETDAARATTTRLAAWRDVLRRLEALPGVAHAAVATSAPLSGRAGVFEVWVEGDAAGARSATPDVRSLAQIASPGILRAQGVELLAGRGFAAGESWSEGSRAVLVNRAFAREHLGVAAEASDALGRRLRWQNGDVGEVVGVVADLRQVALYRDAEPEIYLPWGVASARQTLLLRSAAGQDAASLLPAVRSALAEVLPGAPVYGVRTGEQLLARELARPRLLTSLAAALATLAQVLALVGLFGVVAGRVARARRDLAVRLALGARAVHIRRWTTAVALGPVTVGAAVGLLLAWAGATTAGQRLEGLLYGVTALDPSAYLLAALLALAGSAAVAQVPATRAARLDPARTLRDGG